VPSRHNIKVLLLAAVLCASGSAANACIEYRDFDETSFLKADLIFVGQLTDYEIVLAQDRFVDEELAILTYRVDDVLKGDAGRTIRLWWPNSTFALPGAMRRDDATLVAVDRSEAAEGDWRGWLRYPSRNALTALPVVHQQPCSNESIIPLGPRDRATVTRWVAAGTADGTTLAFDGFGKGEDIPARRTAQIDLLPIGGGVVGGGLVLGAIRRWQRRWRRRQA
jgi:hypothetical protein